MPAPVIINLDLANAEIIRDRNDGQSISETPETQSERESMRRRCRPCVRCQRRTGSWCDHCEDDFYEFNDAGTEVAGRAVGPQAE